MHKERKITNYNHNVPKWLLAPDKKIFRILTVTLIRSCSSIYMCSALPFQLFDYSVKAVIVRPPLISWIYSRGHARGPFREVFTDLISFIKMGGKDDLNLNTSLHRRQTNACSPPLCVWCVCLCLGVCVCVVMWACKQERYSISNIKDIKFCHHSKNNALLWLLLLGAKHFLTLNGICKWLNQQNMQQWNSCLLQPSPITTAK